MEQQQFGRSARAALVRLLRFTGPLQREHAPLLQPQLLRCLRLPNPAIYSHQDSTNLLTNAAD